MRKFLFVLNAMGYKPGEVYKPLLSNIVLEVLGLLPNEKELYKVRYQFFEFLTKKQGYILLMDDVIITGFYQIEA